MQRFLMKAAAIAILLLLGGGYAGAAETVVCKGLAEDACKAEKSCTWVKASKTKAGKEKAAYCKKKPAKKSAPKAKSEGGTSTPKQ